MKYEMDDIDRAVLAKVESAIEGDETGEPLKDSMSEDDLWLAIKLLAKIIKSGGVKK